MVVLLSTYDEAEFGAQARECGAVAYIAKSAFGTDRLAAGSGQLAARSGPGSGPVRSEVRPAPRSRRLRSARPVTRPADRLDPVDDRRLLVGLAARTRSTRSPRARGTRSATVELPAGPERGHVRSRMTRHAAEVRGGLGPLVEAPAVQGRRHA